MTGLPHALHQTPRRAADVSRPDRLAVWGIAVGAWILAGYCVTQGCPIIIAVLVMGAIPTLAAHTVTKER